MDKQDIGKHLLYLSIAISQLIREIESHMWQSGVFPGPNFSDPKIPEDVDWSMDDPFTSELRSMAGFVWLMRQSDFVETSQYFSELIEKKGLRDWRCALARLGFIEAIANMGGVELRFPDWKPHKFKTSEKARIIARASDLLSYLKQGILLSDVRKQSRLEQLLVECVTEVTDSTNHSYSGPTARQEEVLTRLARSLRRLYLDNNEIVNMINALAPIFDIKLSHRTVQRYVSKSDSE